MVLVVPSPGVGLLAALSPSLGCPVLQRRWLETKPSKRQTGNSGVSVQTWVCHKNYYLNAENECQQCCLACPGGRVPAHGSPAFPGFSLSTGWRFRSPSSPGRILVDRVSVWLWPTQCFTTWVWVVSWKWLYTYDTDVYIYIFFIYSLIIQITCTI